MLSPPFSLFSPPFVPRNDTIVLFPRRSSPFSRRSCGFFTQTTRFVRMLCVIFRSHTFYVSAFILRYAKKPAVFTTAGFLKQRTELSYILSLPTIGTRTQTSNKMCLMQVKAVIRRNAHKARFGSEGWLCRPNDLLSTLGGYEPSGGKVQENDAERRHAANIVVLTIRTQARSGSPRFLWRSRFAEIYARQRVCWRQTTGARSK